MKKRFFALLCIGVTLWCLQGCSSPSADKQEGEKKPSTSVPVDVAINSPYAPFVYEENGEVKGFDVDVLQAIAHEMNWDIRIHQESWDDVFTKVKNGTYDIGASGITVTKDRKKDFLFSSSYFASYPLTVMKKEIKVTDISILKGKRIAVQTDTTGEDFVKQQFGSDYNGITTFSEMNETFNAYFKGDVDAIVGDNAVVFDYLKDKTNENYVLVKSKQAPLEYLGFMVNKHNTRLQEQLSVGIQRIQTNGVYDKIYANYFGK